MLGWKIRIAFNPDYISYISTTNSHDTNNNNLNDGVGSCNGISDKISIEVSL